MPTKNKGWREDYARFFEDPSREALRNLLRGHVGELNNCDFKKEWPVFSKVARHVLGLANSGGGCLIVGIEEKDDKTFDSVGIDELLDKADIQKGVQKFLPPQLQYEVLDFSYDDSEYPRIIGKKFQVLLVEDSPEYIPFIAKADGDGIRKNAIYVRRGTSTEEANYEELQQILNRRLETGYSSQGELDLNKHLGELKVLYNYISRYRSVFTDMILFPLHTTNPRYPEEDFEDFVKRMIEEKKKTIQSMALRK